MAGEEIEIEIENEQGLIGAPEFHLFLGFPSLSLGTGHLLLARLAGLTSVQEDFRSGRLLACLSACVRRGVCLAAG